MHVLVTAGFAHHHADAVRKIVKDPCDLVVFDPLTNVIPPDLERVEVAFLSLDLMGGRDAEGGHPRLRAFSRVANQTSALRWIHTQAAGADREVLQNAMKRGAVVSTSSGASSQAVAHTAIAGMLALARNVPHWVRSQDGKVWGTPHRDHWSPDIDGTQALIVGTGPIGQAIARITNAMGMKVAGVRRSAQPLPAFHEMFEFSQIEDVLPRTDWLFLACPLTAQTHSLVDASFLERLPTGAHIVNVARGEVIVEDAVRAALVNGQLAGYYSDVFIGEPVPASSDWWDTPGVLMSPHLGATSTGYGPRTVEIFLDNLRRYVAGTELRNVVKPPKV
ncbi:D-2-hydroxyacid dehydrogenase [Ottowia thiooxydans]|uniref:D-2-hydroxyacid dehydrogenase n=1 Tax=Ottowia thiooxydans TaxID=219182 RepID=UPI0003F5F94A|nr:D-2-hydroxyacid dehydrogenase [Ottowia thiooxydans]